MRGYTHGYTNTNLRGKYKVVSRGVTVAAAPRSRPVKACQGMLAPPQKRPPVLTADSRKPKASIVFVPSSTSATAAIAMSAASPPGTKLGAWLGQGLGLGLGLELGLG